MFSVTRFLVNGELLKTPAGYFINKDGEIWSYEGHTLSLGDLIYDYYKHKELVKGNLLVLKSQLRNIKKRIEEEMLVRKTKEKLKELKKKDGKLEIREC